MKKMGLLIVLLCFFLNGCSNTNTETKEQKELRDRLIAVTPLSGEKMTLTEADVDEAIYQANSLGLEGDKRNGFIRTALLNISTGNVIEDIEKVYEDSQLRMIYERTWKELASNRYGVDLKQDRLYEVIEMTINSINLEDPYSELQGDFNIALYLADQLGYSIEDYLSTFDRTTYERWVLAETLYPVLKDEYDLVDNLEIGQQYRMEVIDEIVNQVTE